MRVLFHSVWPSTNYKCARLRLRLSSDLTTCDEFVLPNLQFILTLNVSRHRRFHTDSLLFCFILVSVHFILNAHGPLPDHETGTRSDCNFSKRRETRRETSFPSTDEVLTSFTVRLPVSFMDCVSRESAPVSFSPLFPSRTPDGPVTRTDGRAASAR